MASKQTTMQKIIKNNNAKAGLPNPDRLECGPLFDAFCAKKYINKINDANNRNLEFSISFNTFKNIMRAKRCQISGVELIHNVSGMNGKSNEVTIDRIDSSKGYVEGNVVAVSYSANTLKALFESGSRTYADVHKLSKFLKKHNL